MTIRKLGFACAAAMTLALMLACKRSLSTTPPAVQPAKPTATVSATSTAVLVAPTTYSDPTASVLPSPVIENITPDTPGEAPVLPIPLAGPISQPDAELSGMAWHAGDLILLPQYPERFGDGQIGAAFAISQADILAFLDGNITAPLEPRRVTFIASGIQQRLPGYEGFEAIAIDGDRVYLTVETRPGEMLGYLVSGLISADNSTIALDLTNLTPIPPQAAIPNFTDEALMVFGARLVSLYEANGAAVNPSPMAHLFDTGLQVQDNLPFPNVEFRITDATPPDDNGRFWAINTFFPVDVLLQGDSDPLSGEDSEGTSQQISQALERLVQFQFSEDGIVFSETPPVGLVLSSDGQLRNWEAIARLDSRGFLLASDQYPATILAYIEYTE
jgi:hypothetical protein